MNLEEFCDARAGCFASNRQTQVWQKRLYKTREDQTQNPKETGYRERKDWTVSAFSFDLKEASTAMNKILLGFLAIFLGGMKWTKQK